MTDKLADTHWYKDTPAKIIKSKNIIAKKTNQNQYSTQQYSKKLVKHLKQYLNG